MKAKKLFKKSKEPNLGYIFTYRSEKLTDRNYTFADLHQIKLVDTISIYSESDDHSIVDSILKNRKQWPYNNEIGYIDYKFDTCVPCPSAKFQLIRKSNGWQISLNNKKTLLEKSLLSPDGKLLISTYTCMTTVGYLKYLSKKYTIAGWTFIIKGRTTTTTCPYEARILESKRNRLGGTVNYIYDKTLLPKSVTKKKHKRKRKQVIGKPRYDFQHDPQKQKLVCITDGISVHRLKWYKATKIVNRFPAKIKFCTKAEYNKYLNEIRPKPMVPKDKRDSVRTLSTPNEKGVRKDRRQPLQKRRLYSRHYFKQQIRPNTKWVEDKDDPEFENLVEIPGKAIVVRKHRHKPTNRVNHHVHANYRKKRLLDAYKKYFASEERRNDKFSSVESWSKQFMEILSMVKKKKSEKLIALKLAKIFPGWNDKKMKRFITYLNMTKQGLNYQSNKKSKPIVKFEKITKTVPGIKINKVSYHQPMAVEFNKVDEEGNKTKVIERGVQIQGKKLVKQSEDSTDTIVLAPIADLVRFVPNEKYTDDDSCPWKNFITIENKEVISYKRIPFHLPKKKKKTKKWKHPIKGKLPF